ncbi:DUF423 domain-containing protein [Parasediminibacterium sp. JCM 36343]|uniref:DUF423 domain-containing protein n=1 Tax=Parasediminibacterium sp. JCM 36343 TaxID=3374279 RepID=UPI003979FEBC
MHKGYIKTAAFLGALSVMLGAFAAHGLKQIATEQTVAIFETGVRYQFYHVFALALAALLYKTYPNKLISASGILFMLGIGFFSGSLYALTYKTIYNINALDGVVFLTPIGGVFFIAGWLCLSLGIKDAIIKE